MELHPSSRMTPTTSWRFVPARPRPPLAPPIRRTPMAPNAWRLPPQEDASRLPAARSPRAGLRRAVLLAVVIGQTVLAGEVMRGMLPGGGTRPLEIIVLALFCILFGWLSAGFWTALTGFAQLLRKGERYTLSAHSAGTAPIPREARTAIVVPICNENVARVFAGIEATYRSLCDTGEGGHFDFYVLSDSNDPDLRVAEVAAWHALCERLQAFGHVFYRWRRHRIKRKSGNIGDFCRRWGANYRYMLVLDADSIMSGECLTTLVRLMESHPQVGILQTAPHTVGRDTLYARIQQFANRVYGPVFVAGLHFWQLGESHYWGHNAIIRLAPFMQHCALARLQGGRRRNPLRREILSHDFVEAALMRRSGWTVWIAYDLPGSYEEAPPSLVDELKRDQRWCYGNLMNFRLFTVSGFHPVHRAMFLTGVMAYLSSPLWLLFIIASLSLLAGQQVIVPSHYFPLPHQLFPQWPQWNPERGIELITATATLLFAPKILATLLVLLTNARKFGGSLALLASVVLESVFSALLAPVRMLFHSTFVLAFLAGRTLHWKSPPRDDAETSWLEALQRHGVHSLLALVAGLGVYSLNPVYFWWLLPVAGAVALAVPVSVLSSRATAGRLLRRLRLFLIPEEMQPPSELRWTRAGSTRAEADHTFVDAVRSPGLNHLLCGTNPLRKLISRTAARLLPRAVVNGPASLTARERNLLLNDPLAFAELHRLVSTLPAAHAAWYGEHGH